MMVIVGVCSAPVSAVYQMCQVYLQGTGKVSFATITALMQKGIVYIPVLYGMHALWGFNGLVFSGLVTDIISTAIGIAFCLAHGKGLQEAMTGFLAPHEKALS